mgnify:CR=1 FL=1|jgi:hypothetical protein
MTLQDELVAYLNQPKPLDWYQQYWATRTRPKKGRRRKLRNNEIHPALLLPSHWFFEDARRVNPQTWLIHCSVRRFRRFRRGSNLSTLHLSTWVPSVPAPRNNLDLPLENAVFGFAYDLRMPTAIEDCSFYSPEGYLFRSDQAVRVRHTLDEGGDQVIFPIGSERDLIRVKSVFGRERFQGGRWANQPGILVILPNGQEHLFESRRELLKALTEIDG